MYKNVLNIYTYSTKNNEYRLVLVEKHFWNL